MPIGVAIIVKVKFVLFDLKTKEGKGTLLRRDSIRGDARLITDFGYLGERSERIPRAHNDKREALNYHN